MRRVPPTIREPLAHALASRAARKLDDEPATPASVLIPLVTRGDDVHVWLTRRPNHMKRHRGQVAFPGGKRDPTDDSPLATAIRETHEELGFAPSIVEPLGSLDEMVTTTGYVISPFVGWLREDAAPTPNPAEIARAFSPPLACFVFDEPRPRLLGGKGISRIAPSYEADGEIVWGATARILRSLVAIVRDVMR